MIKKASVLALVICLLLAFLGTVPAFARGGLTVLDSSVQAEFPSKLTFNLSVESNANITDIRLYYTVDRTSIARVTSEVYLEFEPADKVDVEWPWDMRDTGGLPPGAIVDYWWKVKDAGGNMVETTPVQAQFDDNRFSWQSLAEGEVVIYWYDGDEAFARELMIAVDQALARLAGDTGVHLKDQIKLFIYADTNDLLGAMIFPQEWTGGVAFTEYGTMVIAISPDDIDWGRRAIAHELTHLVIHQITLNPYIDLPTWLDEGLAMHTEGDLEPAFQRYLGGAIAGDSLISVRSLSSPFSAFAEESLLSYAESYSLVDFLINNYGQSKMLELLSIFRDGASYDEALERAYGFDMDGLNTMWRDSITASPRPAGDTGVHPALSMTLSALATALLLVLGLSAEKWAWRRGW